MSLAVTFLMTSVLQLCRVLFRQLVRCTLGSSLWSFLKSQLTEGAPLSTQRNKINDRVTTADKIGASFSPSVVNIPNVPKPVLWTQTIKAVGCLHYRPSKSKGDHTMLTNRTRGIPELVSRSCGKLTPGGKLNFYFSRHPEHEFVFIMLCFRHFKHLKAPDKIICFFQAEDFAYFNSYINLYFLLTLRLHVERTFM